jgi:hypothetical protein
MKNNQIFQRPAIGDMVSLLKNTCPSVEDEGPQKSRSEYEPQANEGCEEEEEEANKEQILLEYTTVCIMSIISH